MVIVFVTQSTTNTTVVGPIHLNLHKRLHTESQQIIISKMNKAIQLKQEYGSLEHDAVLVIEQFQTLRTIVVPSSWINSGTVFFRA